MSIITPSIAVLLLAIIGLSNGAGQLGSSCVYDEECETSTTFCRNRQTCDCKDYFRKEGNQCVATAGARCKSGDECSSLPNSVCKDDICVCSSGYVSHPTNKNCLPEGAYLKDKCEIDEQCTGKFGLMSGCITGICQCRDGYHADYSVNWCFPNVGLRQSCLNHSYCFLNENERHKINCDQSAKTCQCTSNYRLSEDTCVDSASALQITFLTVILYLGARLL